MRTLLAVLLVLVVAATAAAYWRQIGVTHQGFPVYRWEPEARL